MCLKVCILYRSGTLCQVNKQKKFSNCLTSERKLKLENIHSFTNLAPNQKKPHEDEWIVTVEMVKMVRSYNCLVCLSSSPLQCLHGKSEMALYKCHHHVIAV